MCYCGVMCQVLKKQLKIIQELYGFLALTEIIPYYPTDWLFRHFFKTK